MPRHAHGKKGKKHNEDEDENNEVGRFVEGFVDSTDATLLKLSSIDPTVTDEFWTESYARMCAYLAPHDPLREETAAHSS